MKKDLTAKVLEYIESLGNVMSNSAKYGFEVMVKQNFTSGLIDVLTSLPVALLLIFITVKIFKITKKNWDKIYKEDLEMPVTFGLALLIIGVGIFALIAYFSTVEGLKMMLNPEYYAIKDILDTLK